MPELPEVETIVRDLRPALVGRTVLDVATSGLPLRAPLDAARLRRLVGARVEAVRRRGKYLMITLVPGQRRPALRRRAAGAGEVLLGHLGMSGRLVVTRAGDALLPHTHMRLFLDGPEPTRRAVSELRYTDPRRFGLWRCYAEGELSTAPELLALGPDPLEPGFDAAVLARALGRTSRAIKVALLDQGLVAGLGNIYVCEALHRARISPFAPADRLGPRRVVRLAETVVAVLRAAIDNRGTSFSDYVDGRGDPGQNQLALLVFQREGQPCTSCGAAVQREVQAARSTFYCPRCQRS
jgi:formamidopyrimidine-DNA glycosylase